MRLLMSILRELRPLPSRFGLSWPGSVERYVARLSPAFFKSTDIFSIIG